MLEWREQVLLLLRLMRQHDSIWLNNKNMAMHLVPN
jgi:hypothetical protein